MQFSVAQEVTSGGPRVTGDSRASGMTNDHRGASVVAGAPLAIA